MNFKPGRKKQILDIFGEWVPADELPVEETQVLPNVVQPASKVLVWDFEPEPSIETDDPNRVLIPFHVFDKIIDIHNIDVTGLTMSGTRRGNLYRMHRMMMPVS